MLAGPSSAPLITYRGGGTVNSMQVGAAAPVPFFMGGRGVQTWLGMRRSPSALLW